MSRKKTVRICIAAALLTLCGVIAAILAVRTKSRKADVYAVETLNENLYTDEIASYGMVTNDKYQLVYAMSDQTIAEVYVTEGQTVKAGDKLLSYDLTLSNLKTEMQELEITTIDNKITIAKRELERLKAETPRSEEESGHAAAEQEYEEQTGHTAAELSEMIASKEREIRDLDLSRRKAELILEQMKSVTSDGVVLAATDGIVKSVGDPDNLPTDGSAFITVAGSEGLYVTGYLNEFQLGTVQPGDTVTAVSWDTNTTFTATIQEISNYPSETNNSYGTGNPNTSYYPYTAYISDTEGLSYGMYVELTVDSKTQDSEAEGIILEKAYVRREDGKYYVLKADENHCLTKQYVTVGRQLYGIYMEITSGLSVSDFIAFPYGKSAVVGAKVNWPEGYENTGNAETPEAYRERGTVTC